MLANLIYLCLLALVSPVVIYRAARYGRYRRGIWQKVLGASAHDFPNEIVSRPREAQLAWFHAVSVGEVNLIGGLVKAFRERYPDCRVVVSTSTDTGYDLARSGFSDIPVFFCPLDFSWAVRQTFDTLRPDLLVLAELELWPNMIGTAGRQDCQVAVVNGRLSERSGKRYARFRRLLGATFARIDWVGCQDSDSAARFIASGARSQAVAVTGSIKFDNAPSSRDTAEVARLSRWTAIDPWHQVLMAGSTQAEDEAAALDTYASLSPSHSELRLVIVPRHRERFDDVADAIRRRGFRVRRRSAQLLAADNWPADTVVLVDTIGELRHWWGISRIAFVGGSFGDRGGQNMLEPAGYGSAVCFGPNTRNFADIAKRLLQADAAVQLQTPADLTRFTAHCLDHPPAADTLGNAAREVVNLHRGAAKQTVRQLVGLLDKQLTESTDQRVAVHPVEGICAEAETFCRQSNGDERIRKPSRAVRRIA